MLDDNSLVAIFADLDAQVDKLPDMETCAGGSPEIEMLLARYDLVAALLNAGVTSPDISIDGLAVDQFLAAELRYRSKWTGRDNARHWLTLAWCGSH